MAIGVCSTMSVVLSEASVTLLVIAKYLHTSEPPPFISKSKPQATKGETELTNETRIATHATIPALANLKVANVTTNELFSTVKSIKGQTEEVARHTTTPCITDSTATHAPFGPGEAGFRLEIQESIAVSPKISPELVTTTAAALSEPTVAAKDAAAESRKSKAAAIQCTCPKRQPRFNAGRSHKWPPTQRANESSAMFMERKRRYESEKERQLHCKRAREQYYREMYNLVRVQDPLQGQWHEMPALTASCALHCLASRLQNERDARENHSKPQPSKPRIHKLVRARQNLAQARMDLDTEEDRKKGGGALAARSCLNPAEPKSVHRLQALRTRLHLHAHDLARLRTKEHKLAATKRVLVARDLPLHDFQVSIDTVAQQLSAVGRKMKKARLLERELCGLIEGEDEDVVRERESGVGGWRRKGGRERWGEW